MSQCELSKQIEAVWAQEAFDTNAIERKASSDTLVHSWVDSWAGRRIKSLFEIKTNQVETVVAETHDHELPVFEEHVMSMDDLPTVGNKRFVYKVTTTGDLYIWEDGQYKEYNPYAIPGEQVADTRQVLVDYSADMLHGGTGALAIIYNVQALKRDLAEKEKRGWTWGDMVPRGVISKSDCEQTKRNKFLKHSHAKLIEQLRDVLRIRPMEEKEGRFERARKELQTKLEGLGVNTYTTAGGFGIALDTFVAHF